MTILNHEKNIKIEDAQGTLLSLPQIDMDQPIGGVSHIGSNMVGKGIGNKKNMSTRTTAKKADLVLFELPRNKKGALPKDVLEGRCKILANSQYASIVTPSTSLQLVTIGTSNALVVWNKDMVYDFNSDTNRTASDSTNSGEESPIKRRKISTNRLGLVASCRLIQPGGSGSSFLVGQQRDIDPEEILNFFKRQQVSQSSGKTATVASTSTSELCNLFQVAPNQIWEAMLWVPFVVSKHKHISEYDRDHKQNKEMWELVPEEEILFGQRALVETLCEEDNNFENGDDGNMQSCPEHSAVATIEEMAVKVSRRLLPILLESPTSKIDDDDSKKKDRCLAIARKTVLLSSCSSYSSRTKNKLNDFNVQFRPDESRIAFFALRDLFLKYPSYAWSELSGKWSTRLPLGGKYETITSTTEWIEDEKIGGHGGLVPNQLVFSPSTPASGDEIGFGNSNIDDEKNLNKNFGNPKAVLSLVNPQIVLVWRGGKKEIYR
mmetsp:Transcript_4916/g.12641  ORF Transcript_4916/g.12641 Transcript_4916/m.12641 type:complete len:491 (-) Transcript_4916:377-1849(-)|eukprot:CAMPEP_0197198500 /NCGR_PEP_ID=MMETSP1423-20130617/33403_1 /TAXON_ID=476441 /ORGANISM="Pseudo-nitzschia heimii, Strain UNC1101" /LENGTH=490 /DNA_ID=CAMNT_0042652333 /DNA_START=33 /DNA_END=1505 /DNA_ORIENTATION=+